MKTNLFPPDGSTPGLMDIGLGVSSVMTHTNT